VHISSDYKNRRVHLLMVVSATLVSTSFIVGEHIAKHLDPAALTLVRFVFAACFLLPVIYCKFGMRVGLRSLVRYGLISSCLVIFFWCMFFSLQYTTALNTSVLFTLVPAFSAIYSVIIVHERIGKSTIAALGFGLLGAIWVIFRGDLSLFLGLQWNRGDIIFFAGCLAMGLYTPLVKRLHRGEKMEVMTFWILITGSFWLLPIGGLELIRIDLTTVSPGTWGWIAYLAFFTTVVSFYLTQYAVQFIGPTKVMAYSYLLPGLVLLIEIIIGRGWPELKVLPGIGVILIAMFFLQRNEQPPAAREAGDRL
jgi:drug/metabolite transporter (DMT)-like permease